MQAVVFSYINPDLDGVACSIALEVLERPKWNARRLGITDAETSIVLQALGYAVPPAVEPWNAVDEIWLVDTHHPNQLPPDFPEARVTRITDHHPGGDANRYPNADIQNEPVGAAATLITERFEEFNVSIPADLARLLQAAIVSNTLDFRAPATSSRDHAAYERLRSIKAADRVLFEQMQHARRAALTGETRLILRIDAKKFDTAYGAVIVSQLEAPGALELLERADLVESLREIAAATSCASAIVNLVDTGLCESAVLATDVNIVPVLSAGLHQPPNTDGTIRANRLLQRKTDIVPYIVKSGH
jgi:manganese-dependent inorganic pyrophosphatase